MAYVTKKFVPLMFNRRYIFSTTPGILSIFVNLPLNLNVVFYFSKWYRKQSEVVMQHLHRAARQPELLSVDHQLYVWNCYRSVANIWYIYIYIRGYPKSLSRLAMQLSWHLLLAVISTWYDKHLKSTQILHYLFYRLNIIWQSDLR